MSAPAVDRNIFELYDGFKTTWDQYADKHPDSTFSWGYSSLGRAVTFFIDKWLPAPEKKLSETVLAHLPKATAAFAFSGLLYDSSWLYDAASSAVITTFSQRSLRQEMRLTRDGSVALLAWHTLKAANNGLGLWYQPNLTHAAGFIYDIAAVVALNTIVNEPIKKAE